MVGWSVLVGRSIFITDFLQSWWLMMMIKSRLIFSLFHYCFKISIDSVPLKVISPSPPSPQYPTAVKWNGEMEFSVEAKWEGSN